MKTVALKPKEVKKEKSIYPFPIETARVNSKSNLNTKVGYFISDLFFRNKELMTKGEKGITYNFASFFKGKDIKSSGKDSATYFDMRIERIAKTFFKLLHEKHPNIYPIIAFKNGKTKDVGRKRVGLVEVTVYHNNSK